MNSLKSAISSAGSALTRREALRRLGWGGAVALLASSGGLRAADRGLPGALCAAARR